MLVRLLFMRPPDEPPPPPPPPLIASNIPVAVATPLEDGIRRVGELLGSVDCLLFTSFRGVRAVASLAGVIRERVKRGELRVGAVGPRTAREVEAVLGVEAEIVPSEYRGVQLAREAISKCRRVLIARSRRGLPDITQELRRRGVEVHEVHVYDIVYDERLLSAAAAAACYHDYVVFTSPGIAEAFARVFKGPLCFKVASIGPSTSRMLRSLGYPVHVEAREYTIEGIYKAIIERV